MPGYLSSYLGGSGSGGGGIAASNEVTRTLRCDPNYAGGDSDGSLAKPFTTIAAAIAETDGSNIYEIHLAAGNYVEENLTPKKFCHIIGDSKAVVLISHLTGDIFTPASNTTFTLQNIACDASGSGKSCIVADTKTNLNISAIDCSFTEQPSDGYCLYIKDCSSGCSFTFDRCKCNGATYIDNVADVQFTNDTEFNTNANSPTQGCLLYIKNQGAAQPVTVVNARWLALDGTTSAAIFENSTVQADGIICGAYAANAMEIKDGAGASNVTLFTGLVQSIASGTSLTVEAGSTLNVQEAYFPDSSISGTVNYLAASGVSGTLVLDDGSTERVTLVFSGGKLISRTVAASSGSLIDWTD